MERLITWIFEHLQLAVFIGFAIAYVIKGFVRNKPDELPPKRDVVAVPVDDQLRRIREEILKKRAERERVPTPSSTLPPPVPARQVQITQPSMEEEVKAPQEDVIARLREMREQLSKSRQAAADTKTDQSPPKRGLGRLDHLPEVKRAWLATEVFGKPVSLR